MLQTARDSQKIIGCAKKGRDTVVIIRFRLWLRTFITPVTTHRKSESIRLIRPQLEVLEDRTLLSSSAVGPLPAAPTPGPSVATVASPFPASSVISSMDAKIDQWVNLVTMVRQEVFGAWKTLGQEFAQDVSNVQQQWSHLFSIVFHASNQTDDPIVSAGASDSSSAASHNGQNQPHNTPAPTASNGSGTAIGSSLGHSSPSAMKPEVSPPPPLPPPSPPPASISISGRAWQDSNADGIMEPGEPGIPGVEFALLLADNELYTSTDANGNYSLTLPEYFLGFEEEVAVIIPSGYYPTIEDAGAPGDDSNINAEGDSDEFVLAQTNIVNAGFLPYSPPPPPPAPPPPPLLVTQNKDDGTGNTANSLSWAIKQANANPGSEIDFNINNNTQGTQQTITVSGGEPSITKAVTINGFSQGGPNAATTEPWIELKGPGVQGTKFDGLDVSSGGSVIEGLAIDNFNGGGIVLNDPNATQGNGDTVKACNIGTDLSGENSGVGNTGEGISILGQNNTIGIPGGQGGNVISGNGGDGVSIVRCNSNLVQGNIIGLDASGVQKLPNGTDGVDLSFGASQNTIGGPYGGSGNVISGNGGNGLEISGCDSNYVYGNDIGVAYNGSTPIGNAFNGIKLTKGASANVIGRTDNDGENVISGNVQDGVLVEADTSSSDNNTINGNLIGVSHDGSADVANGWNGIHVNNVVGTSVTNNVISGNTQNGLEITGDLNNEVANSTKTTVTGNKIGTAATGASALGNGANGIFIYLADDNTIGGQTQGTQQNPNVPSNVISGNAEYGMEIAGSGNLIVNNYIGTDVTGKIAVGNKAGGVNVGYTNLVVGLPAQATASFNTIGGTGGLNSTLNVISGNNGTNGNTGNGITLWNSGVQNTLIAGDYIGVDVTGLNPLGNQNGGVAVFQTGGAAAGPGNTTIGSAGANGGNVISANQGNWLLAGIEGDAGTGVYQNNMIGYNLLGQDPNGNLKNQGGETRFLAGTNWTDNGGNKIQ